jgi:hypothetical protein
MATPPTGSVKAQQWDLFIQDALILIEIRRAKLDAEQPDEARLDYVVRQAVVDHIDHPNRSTQVTVSVDDASTSKTYQAGMGLVTIRDEWWAILGLEDQNEGAFAVDMAGSYVTVHANVCSLNFGALYCSCGADIAGFPIFEVDA